LQTAFAFAWSLAEPAQLAVTTEDNTDVSAPHSLVMDELNEPEALPGASQWTWFVTLFVPGAVQARYLPSTLLA
jgi:hypothetical protein